VGIIDVPLFDSSLDTSGLTGVGNSQSFNFYSMDLVLNGQANLAYPKNIDNFTSYVASVGGFSELSKNPAGSFIPTNSGPSRIDGIMYMIQTNGDPHGQPDIWYKVQPSTPAVYEPNVSSMPTLTGGQLVGKGVFPFCWNTLPTIGYFTASAGFVLTINVFGPNGGGPLTQQIAINTAGISSTAIGFNMVTARLFKNPSLAPDGTIDTSILWPPSSGVPTWHLCLTSGKYGVGQFYTNLSLDNAVINAALQSTGANLFSNGLVYIMTIKTNGAGPTGLEYETIVIDPTWTTYNILRWQPQDQASVNAVRTNSSSFGFQVQIDSQGIIWFNPGDAPNAHKLFYSFSPKKFQFPAPLPYPPPPIPLPCYNTCEVIPY
jgi:hypothetical protein